MERRRTPGTRDMYKATDWNHVTSSRLRRPATSDTITRWWHLQCWDNCGVGSQLLATACHSRETVRDDLDSALVGHWHGDVSSHGTTNSLSPERLLPDKFEPHIFLRGLSWFLQSNPRMWFALRAAHIKKNSHALSASVRLGFG